MVVPTTTSSVVYVSTGITASFVYTWQIADQTDLVVFTENTAGIITRLILTTDYTVTGVNFPTGGTVVLTAGILTTGYRIFIASDPLEIQQLLLQQGAAFNPGDLMNALDLLTREVQAVRRVANDAIQIPVAESLDVINTTLPTAALRAGTLVGFDAGGNVTTTAITPSLTTFTSAATLAALKALTVPANGTIVVTAGYYAAADNGGGVYVYVAADARAQNGGTIIQPNVGSGRWNLVLQDDTVNVRQFGAKGDNATDDTTFIQAALTAVSSVWIPDGTFIYSSLTIATGQRIIGTGTLKLKTTAGITSGEKYRLVATGSSDWYLSGITFDGNRAGQSGAAGFKVSGLLVRGTSNFAVRGCTFKNWHQDCIEITCATQADPVNADTPPAQPADTIRRGSIIGNSFLDSGQNYDAGFGYSDAFAIQIGSTTEDITVEGNTFYNCMAGPVGAAYNQRLRIANNSLYVDSATYTFRSTAIGVEQLSSNCSVIGNTIIGFREGINIESPQRVAVSGNTIVSCVRGVSAFASSIGAVPTNLREISIDGNTVKGATEEAIRATLSSGNGAFDCTITGNTANGGTKAISVVGLTGFSVSGNECTGAGTGINCDACIDGVIASNSCRANTTEGIYVNAANRVAIESNSSNGNAYGLFVAAGQTDLSASGNSFLNNSTKDFQVNTANTNSIRHTDNRFITSVGAVKNVTADGASLKYTGDAIAIGAATYNGFIEHQAGQVVRFISQGTVVYKNNTGAGGSKLFMQTGADVTDAVNHGRNFISDGLNLYEM